MNVYMQDNLCTMYKLVFHRLAKFLAANGHTIVTDPAEADVNVAGLCAAFEADEGRSDDMLQAMGHNGKPTCAYGCLTRVRPDLTGGVRTFASWQAGELAAALVPDAEVPWESVSLPSEFRSRDDYRVYNPGKRFVGITTGCAFECTYCPHKLGAGEMVSVPRRQILDEVTRLVDEGTQTIVLTGIDTACYGRDVGLTFPELLRDVLDLVRPDTYVHVAQYNPEGLRADPELMARCCADRRVSDFQLPVQTSSSRLLAMMGRDYSAAGVEDFIRRTRRLNDVIMFRTDLMVAFPTETQAELDAGIDFVGRNYDEIAVYGFEPKRSTEIVSTGAAMFDDAEVSRRMNYACQKLTDRGLLVHSGAQVISTLGPSNVEKEARRKEAKGVAQREEPR